MAEHAAHIVDDGLIAGQLLAEPTEKRALGEPKLAGHRPRRSVAAGIAEQDEANFPLQRRLPSAQALHEFGCGT